MPDALDLASTGEKILGCGRRQPERRVPPACEPARRVVLLAIVSRIAILAAGLALQQAGVIKADVDVKATVDALIDSSVPLTN